MQASSASSACMARKVRHLPLMCRSTRLASRPISKVGKERKSLLRLFPGPAAASVRGAPGRAYVEPLRRAGKEVMRPEYPDAPPASDNPLLKVGPAPQSQTTRRCRMTEEPAGTIINAVTKQPFTMEDPCVERGPNLGYNAAATAAATQAVRGILHVTVELK